MRIRNLVGFLLLTLIYACGSGEKSFEITLKNTSEFERTDEFISLELSSIIESENDFNPENFVITDNGKEIPYQLRDNNILFVCDINKNMEKSLLFKYSPGQSEKEYSSRVFAGLARKKGEVYYNGKFRGPEFEFVDKYKVPAIHTDHDALFKCEGPTWESDKVGYRFYFDWRNATDIFGKKTADLVLWEVGQHDTVASDDSYHKMQDWGMDIFKVGSTLGIGSIAMMDDEKITMVANTDSNYFEMISNGPVQASFVTKYYGWKVGGNKYDLYSEISINAGSRLTRQELLIDNEAENVTTGLAKYEGTNFIERKIEGKWSYIALYGAQTLVSEDDKLGIAVFYNSNDLLEISEDDKNHIVVLKPADGKVTYYYAAAWEQEPGGIKAENEFVEYLNNELERLNNPVKVEIRK